MVLLINKEFGLIYFPGPRSLAYINVLAKLNILPSTIIALSNQRGDEGIVKTCNLPFGSLLFTESKTLSDFANNHNIPVIHLNVESINHPDVQIALTQTNIKKWLFSGGGILKKSLFEQGLKYLHIHPGQLPEVKGSTCFYYTLLHTQTLNASVFYMSPQLDSGEALLVKPFNLNISPSKLSTEFIDYVLDPWIRANTLKSFLKQERFAIRASTPASNRACYVMHPLLRALTIKKLQRNFDKTKPEGIFDGE